MTIYRVSVPVVSYQIYYALAEDEETARKNVMTAVALGEPDYKRGDEILVSYSTQVEGTPDTENYSSWDTELVKDINYDTVYAYHFDPDSDYEDIENVWEDEPDVIEWDEWDDTGYSEDYSEEEWD